MKASGAFFPSPPFFFFPLLSSPKCHFPGTGFLGSLPLLCTRGKRYWEENRKNRTFFFISFFSPPPPLLRRKVRFPVSPFSSPILPQFHQSEENENWWGAGSRIYPFPLSPSFLSTYAGGQGSAGRSFALPSSFFSYFMVQGRRVLKSKLERY